MYFGMKTIHTLKCSAVTLVAALLVAGVVYGQARSPISSGQNITIYMDADGAAWATGQNNAGQIGDGTTVNRLAPVRVAGLAGVSSVAAGWAHSIALLGDGTVRAWGQNTYGQVGDGTVLQRNTPVLVPGLAGVTAVAGGNYHSVALRDDGTVWAWGRNNYGQLGDGTTTDRRTPVQVQGLSGVAAVSCQWDHTLALAGDGTVWAWGRNTYGQLGDGTLVDRRAPVQVSGLSGVTAVAGGGFHSLALGGDGTIYAWGDNGSGQLGDGTLTRRTVPTPVSGLSGAAFIAAGFYHSIAVDGGRAVWTWGRNSQGQLGDGSLASRSLPGRVEGLDNVTAAAGGASHTAARRADGTVWTWGHNFYGQLGDGSTMNRPAPVPTAGPGAGVPEVTEAPATAPDLTTMREFGSLQIVSARSPLPPLAGEAFTVSVVVSNLGQSAAGPFVVSFTAGDRGLASRTIAGLESQHSLPVSVDVADGLPEGFYVLSARIVPPAGGETSLDNNAESLFLQIGNPPAAGAALAVTAEASTACDVQVGLRGTASYVIGTGASQVVYPVQGGKATVTIQETGAAFSEAHTGPGGEFAQALGRLTAGAVHTITVTVRDGTLEGQAALSYLVPDAPPCVDTSITAAPPSLTNAASASFAYAATVAGSTFERSLDGGAFVAVPAAETLAGLADGPHTLLVRAVDPDGYADRTPAAHAWAVDTVPPDTLLIAHPPALTADTSAAFEFAATEAGCVFERSLDGGAVVQTVSPDAVGGLLPGGHTYIVRAVDAAGNADPLPAVCAWTIVEAPLPDLTLLAEVGSIAVAPQAPAAGGAFTVTAGVRNIGGWDAGAFVVRFSADGRELGARAVPGLAVGAVLPVSLEAADGLAEGWHVIGVRIDPPAGGELSLANNAATLLIKVGDASESDASIAVTADASIGCGGAVIVSGSAWYVLGSGDAVDTFPVQGGPVEVTVVESGRTLAGEHTTVDGIYAQKVWGLAAGSAVTFRVVVRDGALAGEKECRYVVPPSPPCEELTFNFANLPPTEPLPPSVNPDRVISGGGLGDDLYIYQEYIFFSVEHPMVGEAMEISANVYHYGTQWLYGQPVTFTAHVLIGGKLVAFPIGSRVVDFPPYTVKSVAVPWTPGHEGTIIIQAAVHPTHPQDTSNDAAARTIVVGGTCLALDVSPAAVAVTAGESGYFLVSAGGMEGTGVSFLLRPLPPATLPPGVTLAPVADAVLPASFPLSIGTNAGARTPAGRYTFVLEARGGGCAAVRTLTLEVADDVFPPDTAFLFTPPAATPVADAFFAYASTEPRSVFERSLDGGPFVRVGATEALAGLAAGAHVYRVRAIDEAGNADPTPAEHAWTIDPAAPVAPPPDDPAVMAGVPAPGAPPGADLFLFSEDISFSNNAPAVGEAVTITAAVHYYGAMPLADQLVTFTALVPVGSGLAAFPLGSRAVGFAPGEIRLVSVPWAPPIAGPAIVQARVSPTFPQYRPNDLATRVIFAGQPCFAMDLAPAAAAVLSGDAASLLLTGAGADGSTVALTLMSLHPDGLPPGVAVDLSASLTLPFGATLVVRTGVGVETPPGGYAFAVMAAGAGCTVVKTFTLTVSEPLPPPGTLPPGGGTIEPPADWMVLLDAFPRAGLAPLDVRLIATVPTALYRFVGYEWDFDGDGTVDLSGHDATTVTHVYDRVGTWTATFRAIRDDGESAVATAVIVVGEPATLPPQLVGPAATPNPAQIGAAVRFSATGTAGSDAAGPRLVYVWDFNGDGAADRIEEGTSGVASEPSFAYPAAGVYTARVRVADFQADGARRLAAEGSVAVVVADPAPLSVFIVQPRDGQMLAGDQVSVNINAVPASFADFGTVELQFRPAGAEAFVTARTEANGSAAPSARLRWDIGVAGDNLAAGTYEIRARIRDAAGTLHASDDPGQQGVVTVRVGAAAAVAGGVDERNGGGGRVVRREHFLQGHGVEAFAAGARNVDVTVAAGGIDAPEATLVIEELPANPTAPTGRDDVGYYEVRLEGGALPTQPVVVAMTYADGDGDGMVDGTSVAVESLEIQHYDTALGRWHPLADQSHDRARGRIEGRTYSLSPFALVGTAAEAPEPVAVTPAPVSVSPVTPEPITVGGPSTALGTGGATAAPVSGGGGGGCYAGGAADVGIGWMAMLAGVIALFGAARCGKP
jgi:alpha-tubulin suppressor-like RCC1 family protein/PKD repeat protein